MEKNEETGEIKGVKGKYCTIGPGVEQGVILNI